MSAVLMDSTWESDEALDTESDEAFGGEDSGEDAGEDFGEASRGRRGRGGRPRFRPQRGGVSGLTLSNQAGQARSVKFPKPLATLEGTNKAVANVHKQTDLVAERLERLEGKLKKSVKHDSAIIGAVTLGIGLPLTIWGAVQAHGSPDPRHGGAFRTWAHLKKTDAVAVTSATQLITTSAKYLLDHGYHYSRMAFAADVFAVVHLAAYAVGHLPPGTTTTAATTAALPPATKVTDFGTAQANLDSMKVGDRVISKADGQTYTVVATSDGSKALELTD